MRSEPMAPTSEGPFVVSEPCPVCHGQGTINERPCAKCHGTGVERLYHGTKADLKPGDLIEPGHSPNFGKRERTTTYVYLTGTLDAATWGAELAIGEGPGRLYIVEPTGPIMDDPNLTARSSRGTRRSHTARGSRCGSRARSRIGRGTPPKSSRP
jgi:hypothetical protein